VTLPPLFIQGRLYDALRTVENQKLFEADFWNGMQAHAGGFLAS
jgi:hypothetical protein